ncbi:MAG: hypothetical protein TR69_WS6001000582 [candidate division WS6 bacterium OLB20]|uniref:Uncharacterized protein n=1 Tax=candidate division WS6 bacterium OLB20 TaxID=1617426 RepID=A0A136LY82_9BACT|nr:MAG: hypothetical protein TR69_WS6001000582 [candidate division WS6 bacterium OLB20]
MPAKLSVFIRFYVIAVLLLALAVYLSSGTQPARQAYTGSIAVDPQAGERFITHSVSTGTFVSLTRPERENDFFILTLTSPEGEQQHSFGSGEFNFDAVVLRTCANECPDFQTYINSEEYQSRRPLEPFTLITLDDLRDGDTVSLVRSAAGSVAQSYIQEQSEVKLFVTRSR